MAAAEVRRGICGRIPDDLRNCVNKDQLVLLPGSLPPPRQPALPNLSSVAGLSGSMAAMAAGHPALHGFPQVEGVMLLQ